MTAVNYLWDPVEQNIVRELDDSGNVIAQYTTEPGLYGDLLSQRRDGQDSYYHYDGQGSTVALTNSAGDVTDTYEYSAFGEVTEHTGNTVNPFQYTGQKQYYRDAETGEYEVRRRSLSIDGGRWFSADPMRFVDSFNLYIYVVNSVVNHFDPSGAAAECLAKCLPPGKGVFHAGGRTGWIYAAIANVVPRNPKTKVVFKGSATQLLALYGFEDDSWQNQWHEPLKDAPVPQSFSQCCCCCKSTNWSQVVKTIAEGSKEAINYISTFTKMPLGVPHIDIGIPSSTGTPFNPCNEKRPPKKGDRWDSFSDTTSAPITKKFFDLGGIVYSHQFTLCTFCEKGPEAYDPMLPFMVTYCCLEWGFAVHSSGGKLKVHRWLGGQHIESDYDGDDDPANLGKAHLTVEKTCDNPTSWFTDAITNQRFWPAQM